MVREDVRFGVGGMIVVVALMLVACGDGQAPIAIDEVNTACVQAASCRHADEGEPVGLLCNVLWLHGYESSDRSTDAALNRATLRCLLDATGCDEIRACRWASAAQREECDGTNRSYCLGDIQVQCLDDSEQAWIHDCQAAGLVCGSGADSAYCGTAPCEPAVEDDYCQDGMAYHCTFAMVWTTRDCAFWNEGCQVTNGGYAECVVNGPTCDPGTFVERCEGNTVVTCSFGNEARTDCRRVHPDLTCLHDPQFGKVCGLAQECNQSWSSSCSGSSVRYCLAGKLEEVDCLHLGFSGCTQDGSGLSTHAYCTP